MMIYVVIKGVIYLSAKLCFRWDIQMLDKLQALFDLQWLSPEEFDEHEGGLQQ